MRLAFRLMGCASFWKQSKSAESSSSSERWLLTVERDAAFALLTRRKDSRKHAVELFDGKILAHITVGACVEGRMDLLFVVTNPGENNDRKRRIQLADKGDERDPVYFRHLKIDNCHFAVVLGQPGSGLEAIGQSAASVALLTQISDQKFSDTRVIIDDEELEVFALGRLHFYNFHN